MGIPKGGIAFFDSGIGGLTVLGACQKLLPNEIFYYYGDNKHAPYGNLPVKKIRRYVFRAFRRFQRLGVGAAVVACNTVTAVCVEELRKKFSFPIIGAEPAVFTAARRGGEIFVLTTRATYESARFKELCKRAGESFPHATLRLCPCDRLAGEIERRILETKADFTPLLPQGKPNAVVLGCTHYVYIAEQIQRFYGCEVFDGNRGIARRLQTILREKEREKGAPQPPKPTFRLLDVKNGPAKPPTTTLVPAGDLDRKANKRLMRKCKKSPKTPRKQVENQLFFLGNGKKYNKNTNEQMFV